LTTFVLSVSGFAALALSMHRHHRDIFGMPPARLRKLTLGMAGCALVCTSVVPAVLCSGFSIGLTFWFGMITPAVLFVALGLTYAPRVSSAPLSRHRASGSHHPSSGRNAG
jgi:hypothetical protein